MMVSTRSQEPGLVVDFEELSAKGTPRLNCTKRKSSLDMNADSDNNRAHKRPKETVVEKTAPVVKGNSKPLIPVVPPSTNKTNIPRDGIEVRIDNSHRPDLSQPEVVSDHDTVAHGLVSQKEDQHVATEARPRQSKQSPTIDPLPSINTSMASKAPDNELSLQPVVKGKHKRFGSEDLLERPPADDNTAAETEDQLPKSIQSDIESEDEAPETVTAPMGLSRAFLAKDEAVKVAQIQRAQEKRKRRDRDTRLKLQAQSARVSKNSLKFTPETDSPISPSTLTGSAHGLNGESEARSIHSNKSRLPILLPEEILESEPVVRPPTPPQQKSYTEKRVSSKRKLLEIDSRPPKDVKRGSFNVRVLPSGLSHMTPKASKESKSLREAWLTGQRGPKGGIERRKPSGGFVRRAN